MVSGQKHEIKYRSSSTTNDIICIVGNIDLAHIGLSSLEKKATSKGKYVTNFLRPTAKVQEGMWLAKQSSIHSMIGIHRLKKVVPIIK